MVVLCVLPTGAGCLVIFGRGTARAVGVVLLLISLVLLAIPISPFLREEDLRRRYSPEQIVGRLRRQFP
jgi:hypothetical protein